MHRPRRSAALTFVYGAPIARYSSPTETTAAYASHKPPCDLSSRPVATPPRCRASAHATQPRTDNPREEPLTTANRREATRRPLTPHGMARDSAGIGATQLARHNRAVQGSNPRKTRRPSRLNATAYRPSTAPSTSDTNAHTNNAKLTRAFTRSTTTPRSSRESQNCHDQQYSKAPAHWQASRQHTGSPVSGLQTRQTRNHTGQDLSRPPTRNRAGQPPAGQPRPLERRLHAEQQEKEQQPQTRPGIRPGTQQDCHDQQDSRSPAHWQASRPHRNLRRPSQAPAGTTHRDARQRHAARPDEE